MKKKLKSFAQQFALGTQKRDVDEKETLVTRVILQPKTNFDYLKKFIVTFCPELNFGWFQPKMHQTPVVINKYIKASYYNVIPIPEGVCLHHNYFMVERFMPYQVEVPQYRDEIDWLDAEPPTVKEVQEAQKTMSSAWAAHLMAAQKLGLYKSDFS